MSLYQDLGSEERLRRIAEIINKGIYLLALKEGWFVHSVRREKQRQIKSLSLEEQQIIDFCRDKGRITNKDLQDLLGLHRNTATSRLKEMVNKGILIPNGNRRHTYYALPDITKIYTRS